MKETNGTAAHPQNCGSRVPGREMCPPCPRSDSLPLLVREGDEPSSSLPHTPRRERCPLALGSQTLAARCGCRDAHPYPTLLGSEREMCPVASSARPALAVVAIGGGEKGRQLPNIPFAGSWITFW